MFSHTIFTFSNIYICGPEALYYDVCSIGTMEFTSIREFLFLKKQ